MRISTASMIILVAACVSAVSASPINRDSSALATDTINRFPVDSPLLNKRTYVCPCVANDKFIETVMTSVKADLNTRIFTPVCNTFSQKATDSMNLHTVLSDTLNLATSAIKSIQTSATATLKTSFDTGFGTQVQSLIFDKIESNLRSKCGNKSLTDDQLTSILTEVYSDANNLIKKQLPNIGSSMQTKAEKYVSTTITTIKHKASDYQSEGSDSKKDNKSKADKESKTSKESKTDKKSKDDKESQKNNSDKSSSDAENASNSTKTHEEKHSKSSKSQDHDNKSTNDSQSKHSHESTKTTTASGSEKTCNCSSNASDSSKSINADVSANASASDASVNAKIDASLSNNFNAKTTVNASIQVGLKGCNNWNHETLAKKIVASL